MSRPDSGLTLLEVLVGLAIAGLVFGTGLPAVLSALGGHARAARIAIAADLLQDKLAEARIGMFGAGESGGGFWPPHDHYTWRVTHRPAGPLVSERRVAVAWEERGIPRAVEALTYRALE